MDALEPHQVAEIAGELETDDAVAIIEDMEEDEQRAVLRALDPDDRAAIEEALAYPEESAGRLMQRELIAVPEHWTVGQVIDYLRAGEDLTTDFWEVFVVDPQHHPVGTCMLSWILRTPRDMRVTDLMKREQTLIPVDMDQEEVALRFQKYALISAAVIDRSGRLVGMITVDDVVHIIQEEASEDILRLSLAGDGDINEPLRTTIRTRMWWLFINLGTAILASAVVGFLPGFDLAPGGACRSDADRRRYGRKRCDADDGGNGARARHQPAHLVQHGADDRARNLDRARERLRPRAADGSGLSALLSRRRPQPRPARGDGDQQPQCRSLRRHHPVWCSRS